MPSKPTTTINHNNIYISKTPKIPMTEDPIKQAFKKAKKDIFNLQSQIHKLTQEINQLKRTLQPTDRQTDNPSNQTDRQINQTDSFSTKAPEPQNLPISTGNRGVQTDRQTNRQTDRQITKVRLTQDIPSSQDPLTKIEKLSETLNSLDTIKKDLRTKFKKLTTQEMLVFSAIYQLEEQNLQVDYPSLATKTKLSESSIRDYVQKLIKKGIPVDKTKENNKKITLSVHQDLKKLASLSTILQLREL